MKTITLLSLLLILAGIKLSFIPGDDFSTIKSDSTEISNNPSVTSEIIHFHSSYFLSVEFDPVGREIYVDEKILWFNESSFFTNQLHFHLYPNAYKNNNTVFASQRRIPKDAQTKIEISEFLINDKPAELIYNQPEVPNPFDSTVAVVFLNKQVLPGDSVRINIKYRMKIPRSIKRLGYARGRNFFLVSQWYPKLGVFENGRWICSQYFYSTNFYSDFANYSVQIRLPKNYTVAATGNLTHTVKESEAITYHFEQLAVHDFVWMATDDIIYNEKRYLRKDGTETLIKVYIQSESVGYLERYFKAVENSLDYFEKYIGTYPYDVISVVDVPRTSASGGMEYPTLITVSAELISPVETLWPEYLIVHEFSHQYYYGLLANNEVYEAWLDEGFASYISTKIIHHYYGNGLISFKLAKYYPVFGLNFLSFHQIPLLYTLGKVEYPEGTFSLHNYYKNLSIGSISDVSYSLPTRMSYATNAYYKPELMLLTLERYVGFEKMMTILKDYFTDFKFKHPKANDFINIVQKNTTEDISWFFENLYKNSYTFDYAVNDVNRVSEDVYAVFAERLGDGKFKNEVALHTVNDTLIQRWDGEEKWKILFFKTEDEVISAEIDPYRKNLLDINFANNSYTVESRYWASISLAARWFFWVQNALMILGSG